MALNRFMDYIRDLNLKTAQTLDTEKAKRIKKLLIGWGIFGLILGICLVITGMAIFMSGDGPSSFGFPPNIFIGMAVFFLGGLIAGFSSLALQAGIAVIVTGAATKFADLSEKCPKCGDVVETDEQYCTKCGEPLNVNSKCRYCGCQNKVSAKHCKQCGRQLN